MDSGSSGATVAGVMRLTTPALMLYEVTSPSIMSRACLSPTPAVRKIDSMHASGAFAGGTSSRKAIVFTETPFTETPFKDPSLLRSGPKRVSGLPSPSTLTATPGDSEFTRTPNVSSATGGENVNVRGIDSASPAHQPARVSAGLRNQLGRPLSRSGGAPPWTPTTTAANCEAACAAAATARAAAINP